MKFYKENLSVHTFFFICMLCVYLGFILTWYYKPPWFIDHLIYLHLAMPENLNDLNFWHNSGVSVLPGHHNERWAVLLPLMFGEKLLFFLTPGTTSQVVIVLVYIGIFICLYRIIYINNGRLAASIFSVLYVFAVHHTKNRATEVLADPFGIFYFVLAILILSKNRDDLTFSVFFFTGALMIMIPFTKVHYGIYIFLILAWLRHDIRRGYIPLILGGVSAIVVMDAFLFVFLDNAIFKQVNQNTLSVLLGYVTGGLGVSDGPGNQGWSFEWLKLISDTVFMPMTFMISVVLIANEGFNRKTILGWSSLIFLMLIILLAALSNFPANNSYAYPVFILSIAASAIVLAKFKPDSLNNWAYVAMIFGVCILSLSVIAQLGAVRSEKLFVSYKSITILCSLVVFPLLFAKRKTSITLVAVLVILGSDVFWHNWKNLENHFWWRNGYEWHYSYLDEVKKFNLVEGKYQVHFRSWPRIKNRHTRETMYVEPGIKSFTRKKMDITPLVGDKSFKLEEKTTHVITDYSFYHPELELIEHKDFKAYPDQKDRIVYFYKKMGGHEANE